jgi:hypothetical protein
MTDDIHSNPGPSFRRGIAADLDRAVDWVRSYLRSRTASDWVFFGCGVALGHFFF